MVNIYFLNKVKNKKFAIWGHSLLKSNIFGGLEILLFENFVHPRFNLYRKYVTRGKGGLKPRVLGQGWTNEWVRNLDVYQ